MHFRSPISMAGTELLEPSPLSLRVGSQSQMELGTLMKEADVATTRQNACYSNSLEIFLILFERQGETDSG